MKFQVFFSVVKNSHVYSASILQCNICLHNPVEYWPLTIDPMLNFGPYNVTPISYQHLIVLRREDGNYPTMTGPVLLHEKKTQSTYSLFSGTLKSLDPQLKNLMAFGTDDEKALAGGFTETFTRATHLLCKIHLCKKYRQKACVSGHWRREWAEYNWEYFWKK